MKLILKPLAIIVGICRLDKNADVPLWALDSKKFLSITRNDDELSIVCEQKFIPSHVVSEKDWRVFKVAGPLDFSLTGILNAIITPLAESLTPLAEAKIGIFTVSTYDTDYILVKQKDFEKTKKILKKHFTVM